MLQELGGLVVPANCSVSSAHKRLSEAGEFLEPESKDSQSTIGFLDKVIKHTSWYAKAVKLQTESEGSLPN